MKHSRRGCTAAASEGGRDATLVVALRGGHLRVVHHVDRKGLGREGPIPDLVDDAILEPLKLSEARRHLRGRRERL